MDHFGRIFADLDHRANPISPEEWIGETLRGTEKLLDDAASHPWIVREIQGAFRVTEERARFFALTLTASRLGIAHQWITSGNRRPWQRESLLRLVAAALKGLSQPANQGRRK